MPPSQTLPFDEDEVAKILDACDRYPITGVYASENRTRMKALTLLLRYSGLRIRDAVTCERARMVDGKLFLYQAKTGTPVYCPTCSSYVPFPLEENCALVGSMILPSGVIIHQCGSRPSSGQM